MTSADQVSIEPPEKTPEEQVQLKVEMDRLIKSLPERKRRTFLRFMKKGKEVDGENADEKSDDKKQGTFDVFFISNGLNQTDYNCFHSRIY